MSVVDPETKRKGITLAVTAVVVIGALAASASILYSALEGALYLGAIALVGLFAWGAAAPLAQWVANKRIAALKAVIEANPIETMQNIAAEKQAELDAQSKAITAVSTQYLNVQSLINNLSPKLKAKAANYQEIADKLKQGLDQMKKSYDFAARALAGYHDQIDEADQLWQVALAVNSAVKVSEKAKADVFRDIKNKVAFDTVTSSLNHAFASLDEVVRTNQTITDLGSVPDEAPKALPEAVVDAEVIDLDRVGQKVTIGKSIH